jgi:hypothetical protein
MLTHATVVIRFGFTTDAIKQIRSTLDSKSGSLAVLILDHADVLALEPDDVETQRFALELEALAMEHLIFVVGCFDRVLKSAVDTYVRHFWRPWAVSVLYLAPPHSTWIAAWLQTQLENYVKNHKEIRLEISEGEYIVLAQHCVGASYGHLKDWIQKILYYAYGHLNDGPITKDLLCGVPFMYGGNRGLHIVPVDVRRDESTFSEAVGQGPTVTEPSEAPSDNQPQAKEPEVPLMQTDENQVRVKRIKLDDVPIGNDALLLKDLDLDALNQ